MDPFAFLAQLRLRIRQIVTWNGLARLVALALFGLLAVMLLDRWQAVPAAVRLLLLLAGLIGLSLLVLRRLIRPLSRDFSDANLARIAERRLPQLNGRLFNAVDRLPQNERESEALKQVCQEDRLRELVRTDALRWNLSSAAFMVLLTLGLVLRWPGEMSIGFQRILLPFSDAEWEKSRVLDAWLAKPIVAADQPLVVQAERTKGTPSRLSINWTDSQGQSEQRVPDGLEGPWREALSLLPGDYTISVGTEDANQRYLQGRVVDRPTLRELRSVLHPPAYTRREAQEISGSAAVSALRGSRLELRFAARRGETVEDQLVELRWGEDVLVLKQDDGGLFHGELTITEDGELSIALRDRYRWLEAGSSEAIEIEIPARPEPRIAVTAMADAVPVLSLSGARNNEQITPQAILALNIHAKDDIGLARVDLAATVTKLTTGDGDVGAQPDPVVKDVAGFDDLDGAPSAQRTASITIGKFADVGSRLALQASGEDYNDVDGPGIGVSETISLVVVTPEALRAELDRLLNEVRDRVAQSREQIANGLANEERLTQNSRTARAQARRAGEQLTDVLRRWQANGLEEDAVEPLRESDELINAKAVEDLAQVPDGGDEARSKARSADEALGRAEALLSQMLRSGDLARELGSLLRRQEQLNQSSQQLMQDVLKKGSADEGDRRRQEELGSRQQELSQRLKEWEHRLLKTDSDHFAEARKMAGEQQPSGVLAQAARSLKDPQTLSQAGSQQQAGTEMVKKLLDSLRGSSTELELGKQAGQLAKRQEQLKEQLEEGARPQDLAEEQERLGQETEELLRKVEQETENDGAAESLQGARGSQQQAQQGMSGGKRRASSSAAGAAASQLRDAQRKLEGKEDEQQQDDQEQKEDDVPDVLGLLRALVGDQRKVVTKGVTLHERIVADRQAKELKEDYRNKDLAFKEKRDLGKVARLQEEVLLRLREEGLKHLEKMPIVLRSLGRVDKAMERSFKHLDSGELDTRGVHLASQALYELERLLAIVDSMPDPQKDDKQQEGQQPGNSQPPPFPPRAQLALLMAEQELLSWQTAVRHPADLAEMQGQLLELAELVANQTRPGTRPNVLMQRTLRAMASAQERLANEERAPVVRDEQDAAVALIYRLMEEQKQGQGGQSNQRPRSQPKQQNPQNDGQQSQQSQADSGSSAGSSSGGNAASGNEGGDAREGEATVVNLEGAPKWIIQLPQREQERILQALQDDIPPEGLMLYRRYLEVRREGE